MTVTNLLCSDTASLPGFVVTFDVLLQQAGQEWPACILLLLARKLRTLRLESPNCCRHSVEEFPELRASVAGLSALQCLEELRLQGYGWLNGALPELSNALSKLSNLHALVREGLHCRSAAACPVFWLSHASSLPRKTAPINAAIIGNSSSQAACCDCAHRVWYSAN